MEPMKVPGTRNDELAHQTLAMIPVGGLAKIISLDAKNPAAKRLMEMGITPGISVRVVKTAPLGCPIEIQVRGYHLALRKNEAEAIEVSSKS
jgi:ferrous iron transport protein A